MKTVDDTRIDLAELALDAFSGSAFRARFSELTPSDREDALFDLLVALRASADADPALDWKLAISRCDEFFPVRTTRQLP